MSPSPFTTDADRDAVPTVDRPEPDTDRGVSDRMKPFVVAGVTLVVVVGIAALLGNPLTWSDAGMTLSGVMTATALVSAFCGG